MLEKDNGDLGRHDLRSKYYWCNVIIPIDYGDHKMVVGPSPWERF